ncbi:YciI family protein [Paenibacillus sp. H1-7]|uniref:YciI family protein n=1 Tax=Paenibacillus sp. H1-7 TaxID=2282849 RepID=UPI001EF81A0F|nr:YciI family protein [Paenibacillus sp. H1-7]ULL18568.1 YciI family protein [Paenibacillus sp. H1-7]
MRFMLLVKASKHSEAGVKPGRELIDAMEVYLESMSRAGVLLAADTLLPSSSGVRISYPKPGGGGKPKVTIGPFEVEQGLVTAFTLIEVKTMEEAMEWAMRMPDPHGYGEGEIELRPLVELGMERLQPNRLHV